MRVRVSIATAVLVAMTGCEVFLSGKAADEGETLELVPGMVDVLDTWLYEARSNDAHGSEETLRWDATLNEDPLSGRAIGLMRFDLAALPDGARIRSATLRLSVSDDGAAAQLVEMLVSWDESTTWDTLGVSPGPDSGSDFIPLAVAAVFTSGRQGSLVEVDVTDSIAGWVAGERENHGWLFLPDGSNGSKVHTREADAALWPTLIVDFDQSRSLSSAEHASGSSGSSRTRFR